MLFTSDGDTESHFERKFYVDVNVAPIRLWTVR